VLLPKLNPCSSCCMLVLMERPAEPVASSYVKARDSASGLCDPGPDAPRPLLPAALLLPLPGGPLPRNVRAWRVTPPAPPAKASRIYTRDEVRALLAGALALRDWTSRHPCPIRSATLHAVILLLATSGLRISEALHLTPQDVDLAEGVLSVRQSKFRTSRLVPVSAGRWRRCAPNTTCVPSLQWSRPLSIDGCSMVARTPRYTPDHPVPAPRRGYGRLDRMAAPGTCWHSFDSSSRRINKHRSGLGSPPRGLTWPHAR